MPSRGSLNEIEIVLDGLYLWFERMDISTIAATLQHPSDNLGAGSLSAHEHTSHPDENELFVTNDNIAHCSADPPAIRDEEVASEEGSGRYTREEGQGSTFA